MPTNSAKWIAGCVLAWVVINQGLSLAQESAGLIHPETVVARVADVELTAGKILVQEGHDLNAWWRGVGVDVATQRVVKERVAIHVDEAIRVELLRKAMVDIQERVGKENADAIRPAMEWAVPIVQQGLKREFGIEEWASEAPEADAYIKDWLSTRVTAKIMAGMLARKWYRQPERNAEVYAYWKGHHEDFTVVTSATWRQMTFATDSPESKLFAKLFNDKAADGPHIAPLSEDTFWQWLRIMATPFLQHQSTHCFIRIDCMLRRGRHF